MRSRIIVVLAIVVALGAATAWIAAHGDPAYSHDAEAGAIHADWMATLPDSLRLSELSLPGTHDTGASKSGGDSALCQSMSLQTQLEAGIRAWDIRLKDNDGMLMIYHGITNQGDQRFGADVLDVAVAFFANHPAETIVMRIKFEGGPEENFASLVNGELAWHSDWIYWPDPEDEYRYNPKLADIRGKIVILKDYDTAEDLGIPWDWAQIDLQDAYHMTTNWDLAEKWVKVKNQLNESNALDEDSLNKIFINFTSASGGGFPYFFASGHSSPGTDDPRLWTGMTRGAIDTCSREYSDPKEFPSLNCIGSGDAETCGVFFEGINTLTTAYLTAWSATPHHRAGIVYSDFPGPALIAAIINLNPWNWPPVADAGGPYERNEGMPTVFNAGDSSDPDGDALEYRWDFDGDGTFDTEWSASYVASHTFMDDWTGDVVVEVRDAYGSSATDTASVVANNASPTVQPVSFAQPNGEFILPQVHELTFASSSFDPGSDDATYAWNFGDGTVVANVHYNNGVSADPDPSADGSAMGASDTVHHTYALPGEYTVTLTVSDDDGGAASRTHSVHVASAAEALDIADAYIQALPDAAFKGQADARKTALSHVFAAIDRMLAQADYTGMILLLNSGVRSAADSSAGGDRRDDWIIDPGAQAELCQKIDDISAYLAYLAAH